MGNIESTRERFSSGITIGAEQNLLFFGLLSMSEDVDDDVCLSLLKFLFILLPVSKIHMKQRIQYDNTLLYTKKKKKERMKGLHISPFSLFFFSWIRLSSIARICGLFKSRMPLERIEVSRTVKSGEQFFCPAPLRDEGSSF